jgi:nucleotide-binding universal stress UspA family protein
MKRILTCLDSSPRAAHVLAEATDLAKKTGAKLTLFRSVGLPPDLGHEVIGLSAADIMERMLATAKKDLDGFAKQVPPELLDGVSCDVKIGVPWDAICREAQRLEADLIIVGSHGYGALDRVLGTTAAKVVNHADRSVMVVR